MQSNDNSRATEKIKQQREKKLSVPVTVPGTVPGTAPVTQPFVPIIAIYLLSLVMLILGLSYASVPLYQLFCQATGFGGTIQKSNASSSEGAKAIVLAVSKDKSNGTANSETTGTNGTTTGTGTVPIINTSKEKGPEKTAQIPGGRNEESTQRNSTTKENPENDKENKAITINFNADISNNLP